MEGFTLAEVLITLGIIGVVAAMTMPVLIANKQKKELQTSLKKGYSVIQQALLRYKEEIGGDVTPDTFSGHVSLKPILLKYLNVIVDCGTGTEIAACLQNTDYDTSKTKKNYITYNRKTNTFQNYFDDGQLILNDGMTILIENVSYGIVYISIDVNGFKKAPNVWGKDLFTFQLMNDGKLLPMGAEGTNYDEDTYCSLTSTSNINGIACANKAMYDESFWK